MGWMIEIHTPFIFLLLSMSVALREIDVPSHFPLNTHISVSGFSFFFRDLYIFVIPPEILRSHLSHLWDPCLTCFRLSLAELT